MYGQLQAKKLPMRDSTAMFTKNKGIICVEKRRRSILMSCLLAVGVAVFAIVIGVYFDNFMLILQLICFFMILGISRSSEGGIVLTQTLHAGTSKNLSNLSPDDEGPGCISCSFVTDHLHPHDAIHLFVVYFCEHREDDAFRDLCSVFDISGDVRVQIESSNSSLKLQCFDVLHRVYHRYGELTLAMIITKLSESNDEIQHIISDYDTHE